MKLLTAIGVALLIGFVTFWMTVGLVRAGGWPVNPYLTWYLLWSAAGLLIVWKLKRVEVRRSAPTQQIKTNQPQGEGKI